MPSSRPPVTKSMSGNSRSPLLLRSSARANAVSAFVTKTRACGTFRAGTARMRAAMSSSVDPGDPAPTRAEPM